MNAPMHLHNSSHSVPYADAILQSHYRITIQRKRKKKYLKEAAYEKAPGEWKQFNKPWPCSTMNIKSSLGVNKKEKKSEHTSALLKSFECKSTNVKLNAAKCSSKQRFFFHCSDACHKNVIRWNRLVMSQNCVCTYPLICNVFLVLFLVS